MTGAAAGRPPGRPPGDLPARLFRALYAEFHLHTVGGTCVAVPKGTPWYAGRSLGEVAWQISAAARQGLGPAGGGRHRSSRTDSRA